ncbi:MAG: sulfurtransferase [Gammaproteobacteria bacterium]|nr:sulfurtransferase [Gammaproteobacteria bacterium]
MDRTIKPRALKPLLDKHSVTLLDVRRKTDYDMDQVQIPGAQWRDPDKIADWSKTLNKHSAVVIYCVRGGSVSNATVDQLRQQGIDAAFIEGGIEAWKADGGTTLPN